VTGEGYLKNGRSIGHGGFFKGIEEQDHSDHIEAETTVAASATSDGRVVKRRRK